MIDQTITAVPITGSVTIVVPPVSRIPDGSLIPPQPYLIGAKDTTTGLLHRGVVGIQIASVIDRSIIEITAELVEIAKPDGTPAIAADDVMQAINRIPPEEFHAVPWPQQMPTVRSTYRVDGFELGEPLDPFIDPDQLMRDVAAVKEALGIVDDGDDTEGDHG